MSSAAIDPLFDPAVVEDPHDYYARLREHDPVHHVPGTTAYLVSRMDLIHEVVAKPAVYSSISTVFLHEHGGSDGSPGLRGVVPDAGIDAVMAVRHPQPPAFDLQHQQRQVAPAVRMQFAGLDLRQARRQPDPLKSGEAHPQLPPAGRSRWSRSAAAAIVSGRLAKQNRTMPVWWPSW